jgi:hypothetical protein
LISRRHVTSERQANLYPPYRTSRKLSLGFRCFCGTERINWAVKDMNTSYIPSGYCSNLTRHPGLIVGRLQRHGLILFLSSSHGKSFRHGRCPEFNYWFSWNRSRRGGGFLHHLRVSLSPCPLKGHDGSHALSSSLRLLRLRLLWNRRRCN